MKLKEALQTKGFQNNFQEAVLNVLFTASWLKCGIYRKLKPYDLSHEQFNVLRILRGSYPQVMPVKDISDRMIDRSSNTTRILDKLEAKSLVSRTLNPDNRREMHVALTPSGSSLLATLDLEMEAMPPLSITMEEARVLSDLLDKMRDSEL